MKLNIESDNRTETEANQLELQLGRNPKAHRRVRRTPARGARWWFTQMRQAVSRAQSWANVPAGRPEQVFLNLSR